jgi:FemAB-related protein (PEP-CTERM system-associated)
VTVRALDSGDHAQWDAYVRGRPDASGYQLSTWSDILAEVLRLDVHRLAAFRADEIVGILPLAHQKLWPLPATLISLPFVNYAGLLVDDAEAEDALLTSAVELAERLGVSRTELRHDAPRAAGWARREDKVRFVYDLSEGEEAMWSALPGQRRTQVRKAEKSGLTEHVGGAELFDEFYELVSRKWRDLGSPVLGRPLFQAVLDRFPGDTRICLIRSGEETAAAGFIFRFEGRAENPWVGSLDAYMKQQANTMLYWVMMKESARMGAGLFDFGRSSRESGNYTFKSRWNATEEELPWSIWPPTSVMGAESGGMAQRVKAVWKHLPLPIANLVGPYLSPNLPL